MRPFAQIAVYFAGTVFTFLLLWSCFNIYVLGHFEPAWGKAGSVQISCLLAIGAATITLLASGLGARLAGDQVEVSRLSCCLGGVLFVACTTALAWLVAPMGHDVSRFVALAWFIVAPAAIGFGLIKLSAQKQTKQQE